MKKELGRPSDATGAPDTNGKHKLKCKSQQLRAKMELIEIAQIQSQVLTEHS